MVNGEMLTDQLGNYRELFRFRVILRSLRQLPFVGTVLSMPYIRDVSFPLNPLPPKKNHTEDMPMLFFFIEHCRS